LPAAKRLVYIMRWMRPPQTTSLNVGRLNPLGLFLAKVKLSRLIKLKPIGDWICFAIFISWIFGVNIIKNKAEDKRMNEKKALSPPEKKNIWKQWCTATKQKKKKTTKFQMDAFSHFTFFLSSRACQVQIEGSHAITYATLYSHRLCSILSIIYERA
jgi:hypothetical protein